MQMLALDLNPPHQSEIIATLGAIKQNCNLYLSLRCKFVQLDG